MSHLRYEMGTYHTHQSVTVSLDPALFVPKRRHIKFRRRGITQKDTQNTAKVWDQETILLVFAVVLRGSSRSQELFWGGGSSMEEIFGGGGGLGALKFSSLLSSEKCGRAVGYVINNK